MFFRYRIERQATETGKRKWDGIAFTRSKNALVAVLIEFSGGLEANSDHSKENHDLQKILPCIKQINDSRPSLPSATYCVRFTDRHLLFEGVTSLNDQLHLKKKYADILCPTTRSELKECAKLLPVLFAWKQAVLDVITDLT
ncbi:hypothetical protein INT45_011318 [Circinella minor]|uniref:Uncharacterized protein n=1 Tax=Circinella minor TaxID=1195481 RepID=A0A8H7RUL3_9FUNG|nr:hypothetical protein INT45_011318 [Circinella minor]